MLEKGGFVPVAMYIITAGQDGEPHSRAVVLRLVQNKLHEAIQREEMVAHVIRDGRAARRVLLACYIRRLPAYLCLPNHRSAYVRMTEKLHLMWQQIEINSKTPLLVSG